ncbi:hypothetical protein ACHAWF_008253 [Thalassiosira exigua]
MRDSPRGLRCLLGAGVEECGDSRPGGGGVGAVPSSSERNDFEAALAAVKQGLAVDSDNAQLQKQMRQVKAKRSAHRRAEGGSSAGAASAPAVVAAPGGAGYPGLDSAISKEVMDLQEQLVGTTKEYRIAKANVARAQHGRRSGELTKAELERLPPGTDAKTYRGVGKMFMLSSRSDVVAHLDEGIARDGKEEKDLTAKLEYLERRMKSQQQNIRELTGSATAE